MMPLIASSHGGESRKGHRYRISMAKENIYQPRRPDPADQILHTLSSPSTIPPSPTSTSVSLVIEWCHRAQISDRIKRGVFAGRGEISGSDPLFGELEIDRSESCCIGSDCTSGREWRHEMTVGQSEFASIVATFIG